MFGQAGVSPGDVDVAQLYDNFSGQVLLGLEDFGFCAPGEAGPLAQSGALAWPHGSLPTNTAGGNLSEAYMQGLNHVIEGVRQLRGESTCQVDACELCLVTSSPGIPTSALLLARRPVLALTVLSASIVVLAGRLRGRGGAGQSGRARVQ